MHQLPVGQDPHHPLQRRRLCGNGGGREDGSKSAAGNAQKSIQFLK
jgi:hypothetical protein